MIPRLTTFIESSSLVTEPTLPNRRLQPLRPDQLLPDQLALYRRITEGQRGNDPQSFPLTDDEGHQHGPFDPMLRSPLVGDSLQALGASIRYQSTLLPRIREICILMVAAAEASRFEQYAHEVAGRAVGLSNAELAALRHGQPFAGSDAYENTAYRVARSLLDRRDMDDELYEEATEILGPRTIFELTVLVGYYQTLALQLRVFGIGPPS